MIEKLKSLFSRYPNEPGVVPQSFVAVANASSLRPVSDVVAIQSVADKFYFLLFGAICTHLGTRLRVRLDLIVVRGVNGAVGAGWCAELKRSAPISWLWSSRWTRAYGSLAAGIAYRCATWSHPFRDLSDWIKSKSLWEQLQQSDEPMSLQIDGIEVADLIIDSYLRFKPSPEFDVSDRFVRRLVWQAMRDVRQAQAYFERVRPRWYLTSYTTYLEHGIPARAALKNGVAVWSFADLNRFCKKLDKSDTFHTQDFSKYRIGFDALDSQEDRLWSAQRQLEIRLSGGIDAATSYMRRSAYARSETKLPTGLQGAVVIFLHDFYDSPHVYPDLVFCDFWKWICFTIDVLHGSRINFFLKPHPNQIALSDEALGRLRMRYPTLQWLTTGASNVQLANEGIACGVTVYGTVAHELAYLGVPSIGCARHPHHSFDFCRTARTKKEYEDMLKTYSVLPVPKEEMRRQALAFYYMHNLHRSSDEQRLLQAYVAFWKACNVGTSNEADILSCFRTLQTLPGFDRFVAEMVGQEMQCGSMTPVLLND